MSAKKRLQSKLTEKTVLAENRLFYLKHCLWRNNLKIPSKAVFSIFVLYTLNLFSQV